MSYRWLSCRVRRPWLIGIWFIGFIRTNKIGSGFSIFFFKFLSEFYFLKFFENLKNSTNAPFYALNAHLYSSDNWSPKDIGLSYLEMFIILGCFNSFMTLIRSVSFAKGGLVAAFNLHNNLLLSVLNVQPSWFDQNPPGRTINRFRLLG